MNKTKIVCTIGPSCSDIDTLKEMMHAGMSVARFNMSHGTHESHKKLMDLVKQARFELGLPVAIMLDTKGPEIRIKQFKTGKVMLEKGQNFALTTENVAGDETIVSVTYEKLPAIVSKGTRILLNDGLVELEVIKKTSTVIYTEVTVGGELSNNKSINIPSVELNMNYLSENDKSDLAFGVSQDVDCYSISFVNSARDVEDVRNYLASLGKKDSFIISKIESAKGVEKMDEIIDASDGIMVARGDMGVELPMEYVPLVQKRIIKQCNKAGKIVITATQMLESMTENPRPTRAEVSDVANAIYDLTGAIMLSGESAMGKYPVQCVETMSRIAHATEEAINYDKRIARRNLDFGMMDYEFYLDHSICSAARQMHAKAIFAYTEAGNTPRIISSLLPSCPVIAVTKDEKTYRQLSIVSDVIPLLVNEEGKPKEIIAKGIEKAKALDLVKSGDVIAIAGGETILANNDSKMNRTIGGVIFA